MLNVRRLLLLAEVAERGSLTAAAEALSMTTSAASQQMSLLEREAGQPLIERLPRGARTTAAGAALAERGRAIRRELQAAEADLEAFGHLDRGVVTLGSFPTASASLLPLALTRFRRAHPQVRTVVRAGVLAQLREMLHTGEVELSLLWDYDWNRVDDDQLILTPLLEDPTVLVVPTSSPLVSSDHVRLSDLADQEWIIRAENHPVADVLRRACRQAGFEPRIAYASHDYQEAQAMVAAGLGLALAPRLALTNRRSDVRLLSLSSEQSASDSAPVRRILLARPVQRASTPAAQAMARVLHTVARGFTDPGLDRSQLGAVRTRTLASS
ncbi:MULTISPECIES: LysR family transcriptional regulator [unclassified Streptomyces]|uniref:LysR family transcriptional regulator n=1 Tax=unclassified Streptomyces TaxID=2593676 RepID=UPI00225A423C|nr:MULTISPECIES: LysR family transcriptional regulator [unclassified Streptomyces]MCX5443683.1 LysR family transcriptional regulator [Streptomyces sp. NBC_00063]WSE12000.1 LysR family transcriptional regulator [Streptomyces sp. NBC_01397]WSE19626.1 LysR family transcriptional regulator [Streptomyces sp. NBC_01397]WUB99068.1 LysR family transcriptional regulator [Streptomyces sp. NBC_00569]